MFAILKSFFPDRIVTSEVRLVALALTLINLIPAGFGAMYFFMILPIPGLWIFWHQFQVVKAQKISEDITLTAAVSITYNFSLLMLMLLIGGKDIYLYPIIAYLASTIGLNMLLIRVYHESLSGK
ncbi:MAG: hypothetical protein AAF927_27850 [Bacteroidota bacterium]